MNILRLNIFIFLIVSHLSGNTLTVDDAVVQFLNYNYDLQIAKQEIDKSKADLITAKQRPNPTLSVSYDYLDVKHHFNDVSSATPAFLTVHLDHPIELGNKHNNRIEAAKQGINYTYDMFEETKREALFTLIQAYYQVQADQADLNDSVSDMQDYKKLLIIAKAKFDHGFLSQIDLEKLQLQALDYENTVNSYKAAFLSDKETLAFLLSMDAKELKVSSIELENHFDKSIEELIQFAQAHRADCIAADQNIKYLKANVSLEKSNGIPDVTVGVEIENYAPSYSNPLVGISASIPLPVYDRNEGAIEKAKVTELQAHTAKIKIYDQAASEIRQAFTQYQSQETIYTAMEKGLQTAKILKEKQEKIFALKAISILDLLDAQKSYREYELNKIKALINLHISLANLKLYSGLSLINSKGN